jgi:hypothetical protein
VESGCRQATDFSIMEWKYESEIHSDVDYIYDFDFIDCDEFLLAGCEADAHQG